MLRAGWYYSIIGLILACFGLGAFVYTRIARLLISRVGESILVFAGGVGIAIAIGAAMASRTWVGFAPAQAAIGFGYLLMHTVLQSRATELVPEGWSTAVSIFVFMLFLGQGLGSVAFGSAISAWGYRMAFCGAAIVLAAFGFCLSALIRRYPIVRPALGTS